MDWTRRMNLIMDYVEQHLCDGISETEIAKMAACTYSSFQASFSQITGISFSEYIRRRKLTCAAYDLQNTDDRIMDIAVRYGYQSADAFRVAFKSLHHVSPKEVRKNNVKLTFYCRLHFEITIKGVDKIDYIIAEKAPFKVIGIRRTTPYGGGTWAIVKSDGSDDYMCAVEWEGADVEGFETFIYPAATWLIFEAKGVISDNVLGNVWSKINEEFLPNSKYRKCMATIEKYVYWNDAEDACHVEIWIPVEIK